VRAADTIMMSLIGLSSCLLGSRLCSGVLILPECPGAGSRGLGRLFLDRDGVEIGRVGRVGDRSAPAACAVHHAMEEIMRPLRAFDLDHAVQRVEPFLGFNGVRVAAVIQWNLPRAASGLG